MEAMSGSAFTNIVCLRLGMNKSIQPLLDAPCNYSSMV